jgi:FixJ family two-component response regulator
MVMQSLIAIVDDEPTILRALRRMLEAQNYSAQVYCCGQDFLNACSHEIDCVILDIHMQAMSGLEIRRRLSSLYPDMPVVFMTGQDSHEVRQAVAQVGCASYLCKPFTGTVLMKTIQKAMAERHLRTVGERDTVISAKRASVVQPGITAQGLPLRA